VVGGLRIPFCKSNTAYATTSAQSLLTTALRGLVDRYQLHGETLGDVVGGAVLKHPKDFSLTRESALSSGLSAETPAYDVQQACATGLEAAILVANKIALGQIEAGVAAGVDTASDVPIGVNEGFRRLLLKTNRARGRAAKLSALAGWRPSMLIPQIPSVTEPRTGLSMGQHCERMAQEWGIPREEQDQLAAESHLRAARAYDENFYEGLVLPFKGLSRDNVLRANTSVERLAQLKPVFDRANGTLTAGNSTPLTDGAATVLLASEDWVKARGLEARVFLSDVQTAAVDFATGKEGLLMAPAYAVPRMLARRGLRLQDFDYYEIHEAFAAQVLCTLKAWNDARYCRERLGLSAPLGDIDRQKLNVKGGSLATGHPFAATGGRILAGLAKLLETQPGQRGLVSICAAGGLGATAILES